MAEGIAAEMRFFHWELEYPDVFREAGSGFDAILGNPPWDIAKPVSKEFFSDIDPLYRSYGKQDALRKQQEYFATGGTSAATLELIERRAADGEDYFVLLTDRFTRELLGDDGYATVLLEIRSRNVPDEDTYWKTVTALRDGGDLDKNTYGQLLDKLHARGLVDDIGYRHRRGRNPPAPAAEPLLRVAEPRTDYRVAAPAQDPQTDLFE